MCVLPEGDNTFSTLIFHSLRDVSVRRMWLHVPDVSGRRTRVFGIPRFTELVWTLNSRFGRSDGFGSDVLTMYKRSDNVVFLEVQARTPADAAEVSFLDCEQTENRRSRICAPWRSLHSGFHTQQMKPSGGKDTSAPTKRQGLAEFGCQDKHVSKF